MELLFPILLAVVLVVVLVVATLRWILRVNDIVDRLDILIRCHDPKAVPDAD